MKRMHCAWAGVFRLPAEPAPVNWMATLRSSMDLSMVLSSARAARAALLLSICPALAEIQATRRLPRVLILGGVKPESFASASLLRMVCEGCSSLGRLPLSFLPT
jgi:hypothetical protein